MPDYERLDYGSPDGSMWGENSSARIGFYGGNPSVQVNLSTAANGGHISSLTGSSQVIVFMSTMVEYFLSTGLFRSS